MRTFALFIADYSIGNSPSILNLVELLSRKDRVLIFLQRVALKNCDFAQKENVHLIELDQLAEKSMRQQFDNLGCELAAAIAFDPQGFVLCRKMLPKIRPFYYSLELYLQNDHRGLSYPDEIRQLERQQVKDALGLIIQSCEKESLFREDYGLPAATPAFILPVTYRGGSVKRRSRYLQEKYAIPAGKKIALHLGSIAEWFACIEIATAFRNQADWVLFFHGYPDPHYLKRLEEVIHTQDLKNVLISRETFDVLEAVDKIVASSDIGIAWYNDISAGFRTAGQSSGKIAAYLRLGLPVIAKSYPSTQCAIVEPGCGFCVDRPKDIPGVLPSLVSEYDTLSGNARAVYDRTYNFELYAQPLYDFICSASLPEINATSPIIKGSRHFQWDALMEKRKVEDFLATENLWGQNQGAENAGRQAFRSYLQQKSMKGPQRLLEVGFGSGIDYQAINASGLIGDDKLEYHGADVTQKFVDHARLHFKNMKVCKIDGYHLPFDDGFFDIVYLRHVLEHQSHYDDLMAEIFRVCRGEVFIVFFIELAPIEADQISFDGTWYHNRYSLPRFAEFAAKHGFAVNPGPVFSQGDKIDAITFCPKVTVSADAPDRRRNKPPLPEADKWALSRFVIEKLVPVIGVHPFPIDEQLFMCSAVSFFKPDVIIEWGTNIGASARIFFEIIRYLGCRTDIHTIDLPAEDGHLENVRDPAQRGRLVSGLSVHKHIGDGVSVAQTLIKGLSNPRPLFFIDGDHSYQSVLRDLEGVRNGDSCSAVLVHDTFYQEEDCGYCCDPWQALHDFASRYQLPVWSTHFGLPGMSLVLLNPSFR
jgi:SAM-dependent methyltransferase